MRARTARRHLTIRSSRHRFAASAKPRKIVALPPPQIGAGLTQALGRMAYIKALLLGVALLAVNSNARADFAFGTPGFSAESAALDARAKAILLDVAVTLQRYPTYKIRIYGSRGQLERDASVSQRRLDSAMKFLIENGIERNRILLQDVGSSWPLQPNCINSDVPEDCDQYNRNIRPQLLAP